MTKLGSNLIERVDDMKNDMLWKDIENNKKEVTEKDIKTMNARTKLKYISNLQNRDKNLTDKVCKQRDHVHIIRDTVKKLANDAELS